MIFATLRAFSFACASDIPAPNTPPTIIFSNTVICSNGLGTWNVLPIPPRHRSVTPSLAISFPSKIMVPPVGFKIPVRMFNITVFPAPFGPITPSTSFSPSSKLILFNTWLLPNEMLRSFTVKIALKTLYLPVKILL